MSEGEQHRTTPLEVIRNGKWLLLGALLFRLLLAFLIHPNPLAGEEAAFERLGRMLADGHGFVNEEGLPTAYHPVGYPLLISGLYQLFGQLPVVIRVVQALLSTLALVLFGTFAARAGGRRTMWKALILGTIFPTDLFYTTSILPTTFALLLLWTLLLLLDPWFSRKSDALSAKQRYNRAGLAGLFSGVLVLVQPALFFLPLVFWGWILWQHRRTSTIWGVAILSIFVSLLLPSAWIVRNDIAVGEKTLTTGSGAAFWVGNHPIAPGGDRWFDVPMFRPPFERATQRMLIRSTWESMRAQPWNTIKRITRKWAWSLRSDQGLVARQLVGYEPAENLDAVRATPLVLRLVTWFFHVAVFAAGWSAWWFGPRGPWRIWTALLFVYLASIVTVFYGAPAQHAALLPPMMLAAVMLPERYEDFAQPTIPMGIAWMIGFLLGVGVWLVEAVQLISL